MKINALAGPAMRTIKQHEPALDLRTCRTLTTNPRSTWRPRNAGYAFNTAKEKRQPVVPGTLEVMRRHRVLKFRPALLTDGTTNLTDITRCECLSDFETLTKTTRPEAQSNQYYRRNSRRDGGNSRLPGGCH